MSASIKATEVLSYWFEELSPADWFSANDELDHAIRERFSSTLHRAQQCELSTWRETAHGRLAEVIVLDQFSRNIHRDTPQAFAQDPLALALAQEAIAAGEDQKLSLPQRAFLYMPFMHSESAQIHQQAVTLFSQPGLEHNLDFEHQHKAIIDRFGRYPHRNAILNRLSSEAEVAFLKQPNSSF